MSPLDAAPVPVPAPVLVACDVGPEQGVGHLMRCLALAEELSSRGHRVVVAADAASVPWARELLRVRRLEVVPPLVSVEVAGRTVERVGAGLVVVDSYRMPAEVRVALREVAPVLVAVVDGPVPGVAAGSSASSWAAALEVDQNLGGPVGREVSGATVRLRGPAYALLRDDVRAARRPARPDGQDGPGGPRVPRVLVFLGGTDPLGATPLLVRRLLETGRPLTATVVVPDAAGEQAVEELVTGPGQRLRVVGPTTKLPTLAAASDVVLSAAGTSALELLHLGAAAGVLQVVGNQARGYDALTAAGAAVGLGSAAELDGPGGHRVVRLLSRLLDDPAWRDRLRAAGHGLVDGRGRERVVDEALALVADRARRGVPVEAGRG